MSTQQEKGIKPNLLASFLLADRNEAGCDEAGRGCLAGPVFAAAVILPPDYTNPILNDSKQLSEKIRYRLRPEIERDALAWAVGIVSAEEIDQINILNASILAMLDYRTHIKDGSMFNTPPVVPIYASLQTLKWMKNLGGVKVMEKMNVDKASLLYDEIDRNKLFVGTAATEDRSYMICEKMVL